MGLDMLVLNSGEWVLGDELTADDWHMLIYRQRDQLRNELHLWLPRQGTPVSSQLICKRFWVAQSTRWCIEIPRQPRSGTTPAVTRVRFTSPSGQVLWAECKGHRGLGDLADAELRQMLATAREMPTRSF